VHFLIRLVLYATKDPQSMKFWLKELVTTRNFSEVLLTGKSYNNDLL